MGVVWKSPISEKIYLHLYGKCTHTHAKDEDVLVYHEYINMRDNNCASEVSATLHINQDFHI